MHYFSPSGNKKPVISKYKMDLIMEFWSKGGRVKLILVHIT